MARVREYWFYQKRQVRQPWALQVFVEFNAKAQPPYRYRFDVVIYGEFVRKPTHYEYAFRNRSFRTGDEFAFSIADYLTRWNIHSSTDDIQQLVYCWADCIR